MIIIQVQYTGLRILAFYVGPTQVIRVHQLYECVRKFENIVNWVNKINK